MEQGFGGTKNLRCVVYFESHLAYKGELEQKASFKCLTAVSDPGVYI